MAGEWRTMPADQFCASVRDGTHDSPKPVEHGQFLITSRHIIGGQIDLNSAYLISQEDFDAINKRSKVDRWDVLLSMIGTVGEPCLIKDAPNFAIKNIGLFKSKGELEGKWLYYYLKTPETQQLIRDYARGTTQQYIPLNALRDFPIVVPSDREEMRSIAHILGTLDDKIELNRKMNETLEAMGRALFKSWFVDFDPVRAKAEGRDTGLPKEIADLFPSRLVDSELGEIPEGWKVGSVYKIADVIYGAPFASSQFNSNGIGKPLIRIRDLVTETPGVWTPEVHPKGYIVKPGDIVVGMDGEFRAYLWGGAEAWLNQRVCIFKPKSGFSAAFVRNSILAQLAVIEATETATTVIHLGKSDIDLFKVILPSDAVREKFNKKSQPLYDRLVANKQESRTLAALRDTLLPKLISGEVRVDSKQGGHDV